MGNDNGLRTDPKLLDAMKAAAARKLTPEEMRNQRVSFVYGSLGSKSEVTRARVKELIEQQEGI